MSMPSPQPALRRKIKPNLSKVDTTGLQERDLRLLVSRAGQGCHDVDVATSLMCCRLKACWTRLKAA